jgi:hypothetical protein
MVQLLLFELILIDLFLLIDSHCFCNLNQFFHAFAWQSIAMARFYVYPHTLLFMMIHTPNLLFYF